MLLEIDRYQLAVPDASTVIERWQTLLGAEVQSTDSLSLLSATRTSLRVATGVIEILEPDGAGAIADAIKRRAGAHLFSAGASCADLAQMAKHLDTNSYPYAREGEQLFVTIDSPRFGYEGTLTLFRNHLLHRFEVIAPLDMGLTMGRFFSKVGPYLYMGFAETADILKIEQTLKADGQGYTVDRPADRGDSQPADQLWLHPATLGGMMLGLSRPSMAWRWSGHPERVNPL